MVSYFSLKHNFNVIRVMVPFSANLGPPCSTIQLEILEMVAWMRSVSAQAGAGLQMLGCDQRDGRIVGTGKDLEFLRCWIRLGLPLFGPKQQ